MAAVKTFSIKKYFSWLLVLVVPLYVRAQTIKGTYAIKNVQTGMVLRIKDASSANGTPIMAYTPVNWKCVTWDFKQTGDTTYHLKNLFSSKTLQPENNKATEGAIMNEQPLMTNNELQQYEFIKVWEMCISLNRRAQNYALCLKIKMIQLILQLF